MALDWNKILVGGAGVIAAFKGMDYLTSSTRKDLKQSKSIFDAEDWNGTSDDIPLALNYFCISEVLKEKDNINYREALKRVQGKMMGGKTPFLIFDRNNTKMLMNMITQRLEYYARVYQSNGGNELEQELIDLKVALMAVSSNELRTYFEDLALKVQLRGLMPLPEGTTNDGVRVRFAPNPNGPLSMGHSFGIIINNTYANAYNGKYVLRFDDTDPDQKRPLRELYPQIIEEFQFLTDRDEEEYELQIASENKERYIALARRLISEGNAYISCIPHSVFAEKYQQYLTPEEIALGKSPQGSAQAKPNPDRNKSVETNLRQFDEMVKDGTYLSEDGTLCSPTEGHILTSGEGREIYEKVGTIVPTVWLKTPLDTGKSKLRDIKLMRATARTHPNESGWVWPYLNFQGAIDDHDLKITHMIRGSDLWETEEAYPFIWEALGWDTAKLPTFMYWPRLFFKDFSIPYTDFISGLPAELKAIGTSKMALLIANQPEFNGNWCNSSFPTVCSYMEKGYPSKYLTDFWLDNVWGQTFPFFNGTEMVERKSGKIIKKIPALSKIMTKGKIKMREGMSNLSAKPNLTKLQAQVPYPLNKEGELRDVPSIIHIPNQVPTPPQINTPMIV